MKLCFLASCWKGNHFLSIYISLAHYLMVSSSRVFFVKTQKLAIIYDTMPLILCSFTSTVYTTCVTYHMGITFRLGDPITFTVCLYVYIDRIFLFNLHFLDIIFYSSIFRSRKLDNTKTFRHLPPSSTKMSQAFTFEAWFNRLPTVDIETLNEDDKNCSICREEYSSSSSTKDPQQEDRVEKPISLPCGHFFGDQCLKEWLAPAPEGFGNNTCPTCRSQLSVQDPAFHENLRHLQWLERLDYANEAHRNLVLGGLAHTLNDGDAQREFQARVLEEQQKQQEILELRQQLWQVRRRENDLRRRLESVHERHMDLTEEVEQQRSELRRVNERVLQHHGSGLRQSMERMESVLRDTATRRHRAFFARGFLTQEVLLPDDLRWAVDGPPRRHDH